MAGEPDGCQGIMLSEVQEEILQTSYKSCMQYQELRYHLAQEGICKTKSFKVEDAIEFTLISPIIEFLQHMY